MDIGPRQGRDTRGPWVTYSEAATAWSSGGRAGRSTEEQQTEAITHTTPTSRITGCHTKGIGMMERSLQQKQGKQRLGKWGRKLA